jgi:hypothetical protein
MLHAKRQCTRSYVTQPASRAYIPRKWCKGCRQGECKLGQCTQGCRHEKHSALEEQASEQLRDDPRWQSDEPMQRCLSNAKMSTQSSLECR